MSKNKKMRNPVFIISLTISLGLALFAVCFGGTLSFISCVLPYPDFWKYNAIGKFATIFQMRGNALMQKHCFIRIKEEFQSANTILHKTT